jgi:hypothetical protein
MSIPYDDGDRLTEAELAAKTGRTVRALRLRREKGTSPPYSYDGKTVVYSWMKYLQHIQQNECGSVRSRRRAEHANTSP